MGSSKIFFTSDTHYGHANIIKYCQRPFKDVEEMNEALITNYNSVVRPEDTVFHLGDFAFMQVDKAKYIASRLNGNKHLLYGNHDKVIRGARGAFESSFNFIRDYHEITVEGVKIVMCHYPMLSWHGSGRGSIMLHGHAHGNTNYGHLKDAKILDVGVDCHNYFPISADEVFRKMEKRVAEDYGRNRKQGQM